MTHIGQGWQGCIWGVIAVRAIEQRPMNKQVAHKQAHKATDKNNKRPIAHASQQSKASELARPSRQGQLRQQRKQTSTASSDASKQAAIQTRKRQIIQPWHRASEQARKQSSRATQQQHMASIQASTGSKQRQQRDMHSAASKSNPPSDKEMELAKKHAIYLAIECACKAWQAWAGKST